MFVFSLGKKQFIVNPAGAVMSPGCIASTGSPFFPLEVNGSLNPTTTPSSSTDELTNFAFTKVELTVFS